MKRIGCPILSARSPFKLLVCALGVTLALLALPAIGAAATFTVNTTVDTETILETPCVEGHQCTLRDAIHLANSTTGADTIDFAGIPAESTIDIDEAPLPDVAEAVTIDGFLTAGGTRSTPAVELVPFNQSLEHPPGLTVSGSADTRIEGLALGGWGSGIVIEPTEGESAVETKLCGNYVGVKMNGVETRPNVTGVAIVGGPFGEGSEDVWVGFPGFGCAGNVISGNESAGIADGGFRTAIAGNRIGVGPETTQGPEMPNGTPGTGSAGVLELAEASGTIIGGTTTGAGETNLIEFNQGAGVKVESPASGVSIHRNSIFANEGGGIAIGGTGAPVPPLIESVEGGAGAVTVEGFLTTPAEETVELEFFANASCDPSGAGQGQTYLGSRTIDTPAGGKGSFAAVLPTQVPAGQDFITATATGQTIGQTSEFSRCFQYEPAAPVEPEEPEPPQEETKPPAQGNPPSQAKAIASAVTPVNGEKVVVAPVAGKVRIKLPGTNRYSPLEELKEIPVGAVIDATKGKVHLTSIGPDGTEQSADFFGGVFRVKQRTGAGLVVLELLDTGVCPAPGAARRALGSSLAARPAGGGTQGKLWGSGHGSFRTEGNNGSATVRGTIWLVEDRCDGTTFFRTRRGVVSIRDFILHKTLPLSAGKRYVAGEG